MLPSKRIKPSRLAPGSTIGIIAPSGAFPADAFDRGLAVLQNMGFKIRPAHGIDVRRGYLAGDDSHRAAQLAAMWADQGVDALICARGGYGALRLLPMLDFGQMAARPLPFIGFSDICTLHHQLLFQAGLVTFHGPMVCSLAQADEPTLASFLKTLTGQGSDTYRVETPRTMSAGRCRGILAGGNLTTLCHMVGTPFSPVYDGCILFLEDRGEAAYRVDRMLVQMKMAGCFSGLAGVVLGTFQDCGPMDDIISVMGDVFGDLHIPVLAGLDVGHTQRNLTLPLGVQAELDADRGELTLLESPFTE